MIDPELRARAFVHLTVAVGRRSHEDVRAALRVLVDYMLAATEAANDAAVIAAMKRLRWLCQTLDAGDREWLRTHLDENRALAPMGLCP